MWKIFRLNPCKFKMFTLLSIYHDTILLKFKISEVWRVKSYLGSLENAKSSFPYKKLALTFCGGYGGAIRSVHSIKIDSLEKR